MANKFRLNNAQRRYFGLNAVKTDWEVVELNGVAEIYFCNDIVKKIIYWDNNTKHVGYQEYDYEVETDSRKYIISKTKKSNTKLSLPNLLKVKPIGFQFYCKFPNVCVYHNSNKQIIADNYGTKISNYEQLSNWISEYINCSDKKHFDYIEEINNVRPVRVKYNVGDIFSFRLDRHAYGYGKILFNIHDFKNNNHLNPNHTFDKLYGRSLLVSIYSFFSETSKVNLDLLEKREMSPSFYITDESIFYGNYPIVGNVSIETNSIDFPMSLETVIENRNPQRYIFQWGVPYVEGTINDKIAKINLPDREHNDRLVKSKYRFASTSVMVNYYLTDIKNAIQAGWNYHYNDLRAPNNILDREKLFVEMGFAPCMSYSDFFKIVMGS